MDSFTKTIPPNNNTLKPKPQRSPIRPPKFEVNNGKKKERKETFLKGNDQPVHKSDTQASSTATEEISSQSEDPVAPIESKNRSNS